MRSLTTVQKASEKFLPVGLPYDGLHEIYRFKDLEAVLYDLVLCKNIDPELPMYEIYQDSCSDDERGVLAKYRLRYDVTIMPPLTLGEEYVKTIGHDHLPREEGCPHPEVFEVLEGEARFLIQRYRGEELFNVSFVVARKGDVVLIPPNSGHVMINASSKPLVAGSLVSRDCFQYSKRFIERRGGAYYLLTNGRLTRNTNYSSLPEVWILKADDNGLAVESNLLGSFLERPELFEFLNSPSRFQQKLCRTQQNTTSELDEVQNRTVTILIPTLNEADSVKIVLSEIKRLPDAPEIIAVDSSNDMTPWISAELGAKVLKQRGQGKGAALRQAFKKVDSEVIVMMDGDGSMRPQEIPSFVEAIESGADLAKGSRFLQHGKSEDLSVIRRIGNLFFLLLVNLRWSARYTDLCYGFLAFRREALKRMIPYLKSTRFQIETEICIRAQKLGLRIVEVPSVELRRNQGKSKVCAIRDSLAIVSTIIGESISSS